MSNDSRSADDAGAAGTERFNTVVPDLGSAAGWDRSDLSVLFTLYPGDDGALYSPHAHLNANGAVFGGQLIGQALTAAQHDVPSDMPAHSMQINFLRPGLSEVPMRYEVRNLMRGRSFLVQQVTGRVRWRESVAALKGLGVDTTVEFGSKVLTGMVKRIDKDLATITLETPTDLEAFAKSL